MITFSTALTKSKCDRESEVSTHAITLVQDWSKRNQRIPSWQTHGPSLQWKTEVLHGLLHPAMPCGQLLAGSLVSIPLPLKWS